MVMFCISLNPAGNVASIIGLDGSFDRIGVYGKFATPTGVDDPVLYAVSWTVQPIIAAAAPYSVA